MRWLRSALVMMLLSAPAAALEGNLEVGAGVMGLYLPDYRGSDHYFGLALPFPYVYYEGKRVQVSREGLRARLFSLERLSLSLSISASPPAGDESNPPREGMPEILPIFEIGPSLDLALVDDATDNVKLRFPVRFVEATDFIDFKRAGWLFEPHIRAQRRGMLGEWRTTTSLSGGPIWATSDYHDYFYGVAPEFETAQRPRYQARTGYSGTRASLSWTIAREDWRFVTFAQYDFLKGAVFEDSPLFKSEHAVMTGIVIMYRLYRSSPNPEPIEGE